MRLRFLLDEHLRGPLWRAIQRSNVSTGLPLDVIRVGDLPEVPLGSTDPELLPWCERNGRLLVTSDKRTMPEHFSAHVANGSHPPA